MKRILIPWGKRELKLRLALLAEVKLPENEAVENWNQSISDDTVSNTIYNDDDKNSQTTMYKLN